MYPFLLTISSPGINFRCTGSCQLIETCCDTFCFEQSCKIVVAVSGSDDLNMEYCHLVWGSYRKHEVLSPVNSSHCLCDTFAEELDILIGDGVAIGSSDPHCFNLLTTRIHELLHLFHIVLIFYQCYGPSNV